MSLDTTPAIRFRRLFIGLGFAGVVAELVHEIVVQGGVSDWVVGVLLLAGVGLAGFALRRDARLQRELMGRVRALQATERKLAGSEERLRLAQRIARLGTYAADPLTGVSTWSESLRELYGVAPDAPTGLAEFFDLIHADDRDRVQNLIDEAIELEGSFEFEYRLRAPHNGVGWLLSRGSVLFDASGAPSQLIGVAMDITAHKEQEARHEHQELQLRQSQKLEAVGRLAGGVAHDFNNMLLAITGYGELALRDLELGDDPTEKIDEILKASNRAAALTRQLLAFSRRQVLRPETLDVNEVTTEMENMLGRLIGEDVELECELYDDELWVDVDRGQLEQVLLNLVVNARDAMPQGGAVTVAVGKREIGPDYLSGLAQGSYAVVSVTDTGCGMDAETTARIFEPFFTTKGDGTGLGLATVHGIVEQSGGTIWVYSELGAGTTFKVYLPLSAGSTTPATQRAAEGSPTGGVGQTVLLVEDDLQVRSIVLEMLEGHGYTVLPAATGAEAIAIASGADAITVLLSDVVLPGMGGREVAEQVRVLQPATRVLHMSGYSDEHVVRHGSLDSGVAFIEKPFTGAELARSVAALCV
jgi:two-component system cell cycle sensor histidine kinase/response regulator CckA